MATARLTDVDALRGFALFGILIVNATYFASAFHGSGLPDPAFGSTADLTVAWLVTWLFETKFYLLFSFLFGYSFTLLRGFAQKAAFLRRLAMLFVIGACHAVLLFTGDILTTYAVLGLILLAAGGLKPRTAVLAAAGILAGVAAIYAALGWLIAWTEPNATLDAAAMTARAYRAAGQLAGDPAQVIGAHLHDLPSTASLLLLFQAPAALAMFLLGLAAGTRNLLADPMRHRTALRLAQWIGFPVGLAGSAVYADAAAHGAGTAYEAFAAAIDLVTAPLLAAAYAATVLRIFHTAAGRRVAAALAPAGRMALSNYLGQSVVLAVIFTGYGFALVGRLSPGTVVALCLALYAIQLALSAAWMRAYAYGPLEWLLRAATRLRWPAWRRSPADQDRLSRPVSGTRNAPSSPGSSR
ncbi:DUF418 domain-containing protein [Actinoplanes sp. NEAU-A12]|uniref:DUF418 domain-containing protein n=1 Tax=Actinoplanes sandaracinus TaxID=3045177 RepID=A0ABT6WHW1_9ACTN|nr:DUF418 domain-containing protein [Actinoplanes sandaracinus]MDI6099304.1 DUF418 domain-containing protein [Actinoplanes sandaracinus]